MDTRPTGFWTTVWLLLRVARRRSSGRRRRQQQLLNQRADGKGTDWGGLTFLFAVSLMFVVNAFAGRAVLRSVETGALMNAQRPGKILVDRWFYQEVARSLQGASAFDSDTPLEPDYDREARQLAEEFGGQRKQIEQTLRDNVRERGLDNLTLKTVAYPGINALGSIGRLPAMLGSLCLLIWFAMLSCQGEGLELDLQRRRHPMWEWLFSHPVQPGAVFLAEMLSPIAANPIYWAGPLCVAILYGSVYDPGRGALAFLLAGVPLSVSAACLGKALEIGITLRFPPRSRGAMIGLMSWLGYAGMMLFLVGWVVAPSIISAMGSIFRFLTVLPWPWLGWFLGMGSEGGFSFPRGMLACFVFAAIVIAGSVAFSALSTERGLAGTFTSDVPKTSRVAQRAARFGRDPLYRKEFLWFIRDRSAIVQVILIPVSVAGFQLFNLRRALEYAQGAWNYLCGAAIFFGTYFLWILGPKSLQSEGQALWIALTWPRGLEDLLKAKAWLWSVISTCLVSLILVYACFVFPHEIWKIALVGAGWFFFSRSMAEKSVTLVTAAPSSGETQKIPAGRRWAAQLGMLTFAIGVLSQQWNIAVVGIVFSWITAAAMWQNFRARLPYLYDEWSEKAPPPPTLMHAMVAISIFIEASATLTALLFAAVGRQNVAIAQAVSYALCSVAVSIGVASFLSNRGALPQDIWCWRGLPRRIDDYNELPETWLESHGLTGTGLWPSLLAGGSIGLLLGLFAHGYSVLLTQLPWTMEIMRKRAEQMANTPNLHLAYTIMAVGFAPFAEEYLFRGLVFRALDREWGGWRAVMGSAAFFVIYHPALAWLPVGLLGASNALIFKKTRRLAPAIVLHLVYNAVVLLG